MRRLDKWFYTRYYKDTVPRMVEGVGMGVTVWWKYYMVLIWHCQICIVKTYAYVCKTPQDEGNNHILIQIRYHSTTLGWRDFQYIHIGI